MRSDQKGAVSFLFLIDTSGSMHGQKISAVNAVLAECFDEMRDTDACGGFKIYIGAAVFHEEIKVIQEAGQDLACAAVEKGEDGFWPVTSYACLYRGLREILDERKAWREECERLYIFLVTDGKPADTGEYAEEMELTANNSRYKKADRYVVFVGEESDRFREDMLHFVDYKADKILKLEDLTGEVSKITAILAALEP